MKGMQHRKKVQIGFAIIIIESILMGIWFYIKKPESDVAFNMLSVVLLLLGINLVLALVSYFLKTPFTALFFANALICPLIFYAIWIMWFTFYAPYPS